jgi:hypothetical protein
MIQIGIKTNTGVVGIVGINQTDVQRVTSGLPLNVDIKKITPPGANLIQLVVHYAETYEQVVDDIVLSGITVPGTLRRTAKALDEKLKPEPEA